MEHEAKMSYILYLLADFDSSGADDHNLPRVGIFVHYRVPRQNSVAISVKNDWSVLPKMTVVHPLNSLYSYMLGKRVEGILTKGERRPPRLPKC